MGPLDLVFGIVAAALVIVFMVRARSRLIIRLVSPDLVRTLGVNVATLDLLFLMAFALTVALGLRYLGVLLMGSLIIIPGTTAMYLGRSLRSMQIAAVATAAGSTLLGTVIASRAGIAVGPVVIAVAALVFFASLFVRRGRKSVMAVVAR
jgi:zinc transport system permease protein